MSGQPSTNSCDLTPDAARRLDAVCNRFEAAWKGLTPPRVEDFLDAWTGAERHALLRELVALDVVYRRARGQVVGAEEYQDRFPELGPTFFTDASAGTVIGPYKLLQQIGEGGMGTVFMAEQTQPVKRKVALKVIKPGMDSGQVIARFEAERQALAMMDHVNIARVLDAGATASGRPYFVMELVHGVPITKYCDDNHLTPRERLELFVPVCQAIQHAHQKGIIHRDIKPSNVMVTLYDGKPVPKVIDFGVAKATEQKLTQRTLFTQYGAMVGTLEYMSPEQAEMSALGVDTRSDIYSLGVLLYELLTGSTPLTRKRFKDAAYGEILRIIKEEEPPKPSTRLSDSGETLASISAQRKTEPAKLARLVRGELDWIVMKCLEKDRNRRYETANGFAADVERYLHDEPVLAGAPSAAYRFRKFARRNKRALVTAVVVALAAVLAVGTLGWAVRDRAAREQEVAQDRAARETALDSEVNRSLDEAVVLIDGAKWPEALATVQRAEKLLAAGGRQELPQRLQELQKDLAMAQRLEDIYSRPKKEEFYTGHELDDAYAQAFADAGLDVAALPVVEAAERIRARGIWREWARALDIWAAFRQRVGNQKAPDWKRLLEIAEAADPDPWRNPLRQAQRRGDGKAVAALAASADVARLRPETLHLLGNALYDSGEKEQAVALLRQAHVQYPEHWYISNILGWYCLTARPPQYDDALRYYTAAQAVRPQNPYNLDAIGRALLGKKAYADTVVVYSRAIELKPKDPGNWFRRGDAYKQWGQPEKAVADYSKAIELDPKLVMALKNRSAVYCALGQWDKAVADLSRILELAPDNAELHNNLAWFLATCPDAKVRDPGRAVELAKRAVELSPKEGNYWNTLSVAHYRAGDWKPCIETLEKSMDLRQGGDSFDWFFLAMAHWQLGNKDEAQKWHEKAVQWMQKNEEALKKDKMHDEELRRFRAEAEALLKVE